MAWQTAEFIRAYELRAKVSDCVALGHKRGRNGARGETGREDQAWDGAHLFEGKGGGVGKVVQGTLLGVRQGGGGVWVCGGSVAVGWGGRRAGSRGGGGGGWGAGRGVESVGIVTDYRSPIMPMGKVR